MTPSKLFLFLCLSFIFGIFLNSFFVLSPDKVMGIFVLLFFLVLFFTLLGKKNIAFFFLIIICVIFGVFRSQIAELKISHNRLRNYNDLDEEIVLIGTVSKEPDVRKNQTKVELSVQEIITENKGIPISGKVLITTNRFPQYDYGDKLKIKGVLQTPRNPEGFNWKGYLAKEGIYSVSYWPRVELIKKHATNDIFSKAYGGILCFKEKLRQSIHHFLLPPQSLIAGAMILGDKKQMPYELKEKLNIAGVRHITAISGMHITIISVVLMQFLLGIGLWRSQAFYLTVLFLILFIVMIGMPSSALRAGIMTTTLLFSEKIGRKNYTFRALIFAAVFILLVNPLLLRFDIGFQLSFLAVIGIIYLSPLLKNLLKKIPEGRFFNLRSIISMTLSAQIFTLPLLVYNFGRISLVAPLVNILILPFIPFIIGLGFLSALAGTIFPLLGQILSWPCWLILAYIVGIVEYLSRLSCSSIVMQDISLFWVALCYLFLVIVVWRKRRRTLLLNY
ncbi:MAG TPA: ComEC family competence protein [Candidatus Atribacteria bacterium]|nr:ComEC family competence protein [Candidatus Atribacteria bacterium]